MIRRSSRSPLGFLPVLALTVLAAALLVTAAAAAPAQEADTLAKDADKALRTAQREMFQGNLDAAQKHLATAGELIQKLKAADAKHPKLRGLESGLARQRQDLARRLKTAAPKEAPAAAEGAKKLPGGVTHRLKKIDEAAEKAARVLAGKASDDWKVKQYASFVESAEGILAEIRESYGAEIPPGHPDVKAREETLARMKAELEALKKGAASAQADAAKAAGQRDAQSAEWLAKLQPYAAGPGNLNHDPARYLIAGGTAELSDLERRKKIFDEAEAVFAAYRKTEFPAGKTTELELAEQRLAYGLESFAREYRDRLQSFFEEADRKLADAAAWLTAEEGKEDGKRKPLTLQKDILPDLKKMIAAAATTVAKGDAKVTALETRLADVTKRNDRLHQLRKERTFMTADRFQGDELAAIRTKAAEFLKKDHDKAEVLRTTVISEDWKEERVLEHTDTTKTALRHRVTRSVTAQIGAREGGEAFLFTIHVAKDRREDGSFGPLYGHVMFIDPMLEENVKK
ncbi:MAG: hypothetical protein JXQ29_17205 [Planctomycetes bacterium]|nr:hypothetical protein [Planctomycetota bacterium]